MLPQVGGKVNLLRIKGRKVQPVASPVGRIYPKTAQKTPMGGVFCVLRPFFPAAKIFLDTVSHKQYNR